MKIGFYTSTKDIVLWIIALCWISIGLYSLECNDTYLTSFWVQGSALMVLGTFAAYVGSNAMFRHPDTKMARPFWKLSIIIVFLCYSWNILDGLHSIIHLHQTKQVVGMGTVWVVFAVSCITDIRRIDNERSSDIEDSDSEHE